MYVYAWYVKKKKQDKEHFTVCVLQFHKWNDQYDKILPWCFLEEPVNYL